VQPGTPDAVIAETVKKKKKSIGWRMYIVLLQQVYASIHQRYSPNRGLGLLL
jgi:hypothetical protein